MKKLSEQIKEVERLVSSKGIKTISFDIDGTVYPIKKVQVKWWLKFFQDPSKAMRFLGIKKAWEGRREGKEGVLVSSEDIEFFEQFLVQDLLHHNLVPNEIRYWIADLRKKGLNVFFLSDHGAEAKLNVLGLTYMGVAINCLMETNQLKPHAKITDLLLNRYHIVPGDHLHLGDRWTDEEQAKLLGSHFLHFAPLVYF